MKKILTSLVLLSLICVVLVGAETSEQSQTTSTGVPRPLCSGEGDYIYNDETEGPTSCCAGFVSKLVTGAPPAVVGRCTADCVGEGESLGAVVPGNDKQCCSGLAPYVPEGIVGTRGTCMQCASEGENVYVDDSNGPTICCSGLILDRIVGSATMKGRCIVEEDYVEGELLVGFNDDVTKEEAENIISSHGLSIKEFHDAVSVWALVNVPEGEEQSWINILEKESIIVYAELNSIVSAHSGTQTQTQAKALTQSQIQNIIQTKNKIRANVRAGECPTDCTCTGSVTKCQVNGGREMTIRAGKSGNMIVQVKGVNMSTNVTLYKTNKTIYGVFKNDETKIIKILPDGVKEKIRQRTRARLEEHNITLDEDGIYQVQVRKRARLFFILPVREKVRAQINSETGEIIQIRNSWWGFLARDIKEDIVGGCGTVTPGLEDECCQNLGYDSWNSESLECE